MANKTIDQYSLSSSLNDDDLFLVAKYDPATSKYTAYNKYKVSALKNLIKSADISEMFPMTEKLKFPTILHRTSM